MSCSITGMIPHWKVVYEDGQTKLYNSARTMARDLGCCTQFMVQNMSRERLQGKKIPETRTQRFKDAGISSVINLKTGLSIF